MSKETISIIVPFYNEKENIESLLHSLQNFEKNNFNLVDFQFVFVDDGSTDNSFQILTNNIQLTNFKILRLSRNYGSHAALRAGILHSTGNYVTFLYSDLQDNPDVIINLYSKVKEGNDIVWAYRENENIPLFSKLYAWLMREYAINTFSENGQDVVMFTKQVANELNDNIESYSSIFLQILDLGFTQSNIKYTRIHRQKGKSKWTLSKKVKLLIDSFVSFSYAPLRLVTLMGVIFFTFGIVYSVYIIIDYFFLGRPVEGWSSLIVIMCIGFGFTNISLGIIAEYLYRTLEASRTRKVFVISKIIENK
jgi:polyisoprenyl-phosphate glycosyltransferase